MSHQTVPSGAVLLLVACVCGIPASGQLVAGADRRSAPVRIVQHATTRDAGVAFKVAPSPFMTLGSDSPASPDEEFDAQHPFLAPLRLSDGRIVVTDRSRLMFFSSDGRYLYSAGRSGPGPQEFHQLRSVCRVSGDTLLAVDYSDRRLSLWTDRGVFLRALTPRNVPLADICFGDGTFLAGSAARVRSEALEGRARRYSRLRLDGSVVNELGEYGTEWPGPILRRVSVIARDGRLYVADALTYTVRVFFKTGASLWELRSSDLPARVTDAEWADALAEPDFPATRETMRPARWPAYGRVVLDATNRIWIQDYRARDRWTVFDSVGALLGTVTIPISLGDDSTLVAAELDAVAIRFLDEHGSPRISYFRLVAVR